MLLHLLIAFCYGLCLLFVWEGGKCNVMSSHGTRRMSSYGQPGHERACLYVEVVLTGTGLDGLRPGS